mmetsp:Transcript_44265/g.140772  ORF Transcript_44265/g.140772 Transcript_44265/m.140772 type:complete len:391 (-) Transcript_44265:1339-2511(-)
MRDVQEAVDDEGLPRLEARRRRPEAGGGGALEGPTTGPRSPEVGRLGRLCGRRRCGVRHLVALLVGAILQPLVGTFATLHNLVLRAVLLFLGKRRRLIHLRSRSCLLLRVLQLVSHRALLLLALLVLPLRGRPRRHVARAVATEDFSERREPHLEIAAGVDELQLHGLSVHDEAEPVVVDPDLPHVVSLHAAQAEPDRGPARVRVVLDAAGVEEEVLDLPAATTEDGEVAAMQRLLLHHHVILHLLLLCLLLLLGLREPGSTFAVLPAENLGQSRVPLLEIGSRNAILVGNAQRELRAAVHADEEARVADLHVLDVACHHGPRGLGHGLEVLGRAEVEQPVLVQRKVADALLLVGPPLDGELPGAQWHRYTFLLLILPCRRVGDCQAPLR